MAKNCAAAAQLQSCVLNCSDNINYGFKLQTTATTVALVQQTTFAS